ncbi:MAG: hypothetical protein HKM89_11685 [Gemmatimonadales bacterium]|nr:hypothetical protein [Gemmatimonadales bacterium]
MVPPPRLVLAIIITLFAIPAPGAAQEQGWSLLAEAGWGRTAGASGDSETGAAFRPANTLVVGLAAGRRLGPFELGLVLRTARSDLTIADGQVTITTDDLRLTLYELSPELGTRLVRVSRYADIHVAAGPVIHIWRVTGSEGRVRVGARAALILESLVADGVSGVVRAEGAVTGSMFAEGELPPEFEEQRAFRVLIAFGLRYRWR